MIQVYVVTAQLGQLDPEATVSKITAASAMITRLHPALRGYTAQASEGLLTLRLRVSGRDRWATSKAARAAASNMLLRLKLPTTEAFIELEHTMPSARSLTKEQRLSAHRPQTDAP